MRSFVRRPRSIYHSIGEHFLLRAIFWDNDGILVETEHLYFLATQRALALEGVPLTRADYIENFLVHARGAWHLAAERGVSAARIEELKVERGLLFRQLLATEDLLIPGVQEVLDSLHGRVAMGIVTSSEREHFELIHSRTNLLPYFDFVLAQGDYEKSKPHPDPYLSALERTGLDASQCIVVEDSRRGLAAAVAAGIRCIVLPGALTAESDFSEATRVVTSLPQLRGVLEELLAGAS